MKKYSNYVLGFVIITLMFLSSVIFRTEEIIFPEIFALVIGGIVSKKQIWNTSKPRFLTLMAFSSVIGIIATNFLQLNTIYKIMIVLFVEIIVLSLSKTNIYPMISAGILPILLNSKSILYPISVVLLTAIVILFRVVLEKGKIIEKPNFTPVKFNFKSDTLKWIFIYIVILCLCVFSIKLDLNFIIAPPIIVLFCELVFGKRNSVKGYLKIALLTCFLAIFGSILVYIFVFQQNFDKFLVAILIITAMFFVAYFSKMFFPPAYAISILPLILSEKAVLTFPFVVCAHTIILITIAFALQNIQKKRTLI